MKPLTKGSLKTLADLVLYARSRARRSALRNDPIAWAYWRETAKWADETSLAVRPTDQWPATLELMRREVGRLGSWDFRGAAELYARAKWLAVLIRNSGGRVDMRNSLAWMHRLERPAEGGRRG